MSEIPEIKTLRPIQVFRTRTITETVDAIQVTEDNQSELRKEADMYWLQIGHWVLGRSGIWTTWCDDEYFHKEFRREQ